MDYSEDEKAPVRSVASCGGFSENAILATVQSIDTSLRKSKSHKESKKQKGRKLLSLSLHFTLIICDLFRLSKTYMTSYAISKSFE
jgi:hypothetical protein